LTLPTNNTNIQALSHKWLNGNYLCRHTTLTWTIDQLWTMDNFVIQYFVTWVLSDKVLTGTIVLVSFILPRQTTNINILIMPFSVGFCSLVHLRPKALPQHCIPEHRQLPFVCINEYFCVDSLLFLSVILVTASTAQMYLLNANERRWQLLKFCRSDGGGRNTTQAVMVCTFIVLEILLCKKLIHVKYLQSWLNNFKTYQFLILKLLVLPCCSRIVLPQNEVDSSVRNRK
jgi:hypothetical protein